MTKLADVLSFAGTPERIVAPSQERFVTLRMHGKGAVERLIKDGKTPVPFTGYRVRSGQLIYSRIDARNGAFAIVPANLVGAVVSKDFPVFEIRRDRVDANYLRYLLIGGLLQANIRALSFGATNRQRVDEAMFLDFEASIPSLHEQRRIAAILDTADTIRTKRRTLIAHYDSLAQSLFSQAVESAKVNASLDDLGIDFVSGKNVVATGTAGHPVNRVLKVNAISSGDFLPYESKPMPADYIPPGAHRVRKGDVLFGRASGSLELLGATAVVDREVEDLYLPDKVWRLVVEDDGPVLPGFVLGLLRSRQIRLQIQKSASGAAGVKNIAKAKLLQIVVPVPDIAHQRSYAVGAAEIAKKRSRVERALTVDGELFESLQSRAFSGGL